MWSKHQGSLNDQRGQWSSKEQMWLEMNHKHSDHVVQEDMRKNQKEH